MSETIVEKKAAIVDDWVETCTHDVDFLIAVLWERADSMSDDEVEQDYIDLGLGEE